MLTVAYVFIDTNTALHFKRPPEIDWLSLTKANQVVLVAAPVLMYELDKQKVHNPSKKLRERADTYVKWLVQFVRDQQKEVRQGVCWHFISHEPQQLAFCKHNLSPNIADDRLIASVLCFPYKPVYVATADIGLEVKLYARRITPLILPEDAKLPKEPDPRDKKIRELQRQITKYESRLPRLSLISEDGKNLLEVNIHPPLSEPLLSEIRAKHPFMTEDLIYALNLSGRGITFEFEKINQYNQELEQFFAEYGSYLDELTMWKEKVQLLVEVKLVLSNDGTALASDIDVVLEFPEDIELLKRQDFPKRPKKPEPPKRPGFKMEVFDKIREISKIINISGSAINEIPRRIGSKFQAPHDFEGKPLIKSEQHQITFMVSKLKHGSKHPLAPFLFGFPDQAAVRSFSIDFHLSADELPEAVADDFHIVVSDPSDTDDTE